MRVAHLIASHLTNHGPTDGIRAQLSAHSKGLVQAEAWSMYPPLVGRDPGLLFNELGVPHKVLGTSRRLADPRIVQALLDALREFRPHILQTHLVRANLWGRMAARIEGNPPVICTLRGVEDYFTDRRTTSRVTRWIERHSLRLVARYVAVSDGVRTAAIRHLGISPEAIVTIRNAVDLQPFVLPGDRRAARQLMKVGDTDLVLGTVSVLEPRKNVELLIDIAGRVVKACPALPLRVIIIGDGPSKATLEAHVNKAGLDSTVHFIGFCRNIPQLLPGLDVFALTSLGEGLPRAVMEAMAAGVPCVLTDVGGNREAVVNGETGYVHEVADVDGMTRSAIRLLSHRELREQFGVRSREVAFRQFSPVRLAREYEALYSCVLDERRRERDA